MEGLEGLESFGEFWRVCGLANGSFESLRKPLLWPGPGVPVGEVALALGCMLGKVFGILEVIAVDLRCLLGTVFGGFGGFRRVWSVWRVWRVWRVLESFGGFAGWQTAALKA